MLKNLGLSVFGFILIASLCNSKVIHSSNLYDGDSLNSYSDYDDEYSTDIAVKLKPDASDELVSELFAISHGIEKIARLSDLDTEDRLFHFKLKDLNFENEDNMSPVETSNPRHRRKRAVHSKLDLMRQDDRVEFVLPQRYLSRHKRFYKKDVLQDLDDIIEEMNEEELKEKLENIVNDINYKIDEKNVFKRKRPLPEYDFENTKHSKNIDKKAFYSNLPKEISFNDENFLKQWYLIDEGQLNIPLSHDLNVKLAWINGYTGKNITIVIVDDGLDHEHPDFDGKYRSDLSYDFNDENDTNHDPMPRTFDNQNNHGTRCAGAAAANANNSVCGVGIAYDAQIAGIRILDGPITDLLEARALSYKAKDVDIRSASWGPRDDGAHMEYPGMFVNLALEEGVKRGRNGKGTLFVWASGNGGGNDDDCSCDGYVSNWNIISIGSVNHHGMKPYFMELCPSTMAVVYSGGQTQLSGDPDDPGVRVVASDVRGKCTTTFQGTSSAAPLAAGAFALVLEANPDLSYRDVMYLIAKTSRIPNIEDVDGWIINGANYHVNEKYGFGVLDVSQMIQEAQTWKNVPPRERCEFDYKDDLPTIGSDDRIVVTLFVPGCDEINSLEHVVANISFSYSTRGDLKLTLVSPQGTPSEILSYRKNDFNPNGIFYFPFMTVYNWGESPVGEWQLIIESRSTNGKDNKGALEHFSLTFFGTKFPENSDYKITKRLALDNLDNNKRAYIPDDLAVRQIYNSELEQSQKTKIIQKDLLKNNPDLKDLLRNIDNSDAGSR